jgi:hypothetical protein
VQRYAAETFYAIPSSLVSERKKQSPIVVVASRQKVTRSSVAHAVIGRSSIMSWVEG